MNEPVIIEDYNSDWAKEYEQEKKMLRQVLNGKIIDIEHIGSTSIKGLGGKPIIDIMVGVSDLKEVNHFIIPLEKMGYEHVVHKEFSNRGFFRKGAWRAGTHHLHFYKHGSEDWNQKILFRNYLKNHPSVREQYHQLKKELAKEYKFDRSAYTKAKVTFIKKAKEEQLYK